MPCHSCHPYILVIPIITIQILFHFLYLFQLLLICLMCAILFAPITSTMISTGRVYGFRTFIWLPKCLLLAKAHQQESNLRILRVLLQLFLGYLPVRQSYFLPSNFKTKWLLLSISYLEILLFVKHRFKKFFAKPADSPYKNGCNTNQFTNSKI